MTYLAAILIVLGIAFRALAIWTLRDCFSFGLCVPREIVTRGIYRYLRHPAYLGSIMILSGVALLHAGAAVIWLAVAFFLSRAVQEEQLLSMDARYRSYQQRTGMFFPKLRH